MLEGVCERGSDRGVGDVVVFNMGTLLLTAAGTEKEGENGGRERERRVSICYFSGLSSGDFVHQS